MERYDLGEVPATESQDSDAANNVSDSIERRRIQNRLPNSTKPIQYASTVSYKSSAPRMCSFNIRVMSAFQSQCRLSLRYSILPRWPLSIRCIVLQRRPEGNK
ncbi:hypothetical protein OIDMADRAFT_15943 [Oidiodendron maius Zn]|uniref:Uncharacterized protein n=1 Tax=Oidiodendron maius (strain Zn) TaxID=913774 RepID=A0A0C3D6D9_OIDMZ|nr:hypothetical protein OIDMADRAFT_15943 [Oidiodendron maius Zn]